MATGNATDTDRMVNGALSFIANTQNCLTRCSLLREWKRINGVNATYDALLSALIEAKETDAAGELVKCLESNDYFCVV